MTVNLIPGWEFLQRRVQILNNDGVLRVRELRQAARTLFPFVKEEEQRRYLSTMADAQQIALNLEFLLDIFGVDPLPSVSIPQDNNPNPTGVA